MFKNRTDRYEDLRGQKNIDQMLEVKCSCGCSNYGIYFDYEFARYVVICSGCFNRRSIATNSIPDNPEAFDSED